MTTLRATVVGAGLAGAECAYQLAEAGVQVRLLEQKPLTRSAAHHSPSLAELVCSNSLRGASLVNAVGLLKEEMRRLGSLVLAVADRTKVPAGGALAVDRERFSAEITAVIDAHPRIERVHTLVEGLPSERPLVLATGPMTGDALTAAIVALVGREHLAYYDSIAPIVSSEGIDMDVVFRASRYDKGGDAAYLNCPMDQAQYEAFVAALIAAEKVALHDFEDPRYFEGCLPVEVMAERGLQTLAFGPMKPVGLTDPRTGKRAHAVVQLRQEDEEASAYNLVGFQTRMTRSEQQRVFAMIPGLGNVRFERYGSVHRNTFLDSPQVLDDDLMLRAAPGVYVAGQLSGVEGYVESAASGLMVGLMLADRLLGRSIAPPPSETALGALRSHLRKPSDDFQPSNVVWSMFPPLGHGRRGRRERREAHAERALVAIERWHALRRGEPGTKEEQAAQEVRP